MTDSEIIKALEKEIQLVKYVDGFSADNVSLELLQHSLDLINRQKAEIKRLKEENNRLEMDNKILSINADTAFQDGLNEAQDLYSEQIKAEVRAKAIKEFAERLKKAFVLCDPMFNKYIDNLLKEMVGDSDC